MGTVPCAKDVYERCGIQEALERNIDYMAGTGKQKSFIRRMPWNRFSWDICIDHLPKRNAFIPFLLGKYGYVEII